jgi:hypothetical protein
MKRIWVMEKESNLQEKHTADSRDEQTSAKEEKRDATSSTSQENTIVRPRRRIRAYQQRIDYWQ